MCAEVVFNPIQLYINIGDLDEFLTADAIHFLYTIRCDRQQATDVRCRTRHCPRSHAADTVNESVFSCLRTLTERVTARVRRPLIR